MDVEYRLTTALIAIHHQPVAGGGDTLQFCNLARCQNHFVDNSGIGRREIIEGAYVFARHHENMRWRLGIDIAESQQLIGLHDQVWLDFALCHFAEQTINHDFLAYILATAEGMRQRAAIYKFQLPSQWHAVGNACGPDAAGTC